MKNLWIVGLLFLSCTTLKDKELVSSSGMPVLKLKEHQSFLNHRSLASVGSPSVSNKQVYFFALYHQFLKYKTLTKANVNLKSCPQFHHDLLTQVQSVVQTSFMGPAGLKNFFQSSRAKVYYPELNLPIPGEKRVLGDSSQYEFKSNFKAAIKDQMQKTLVELDELCDKGSSDNYYVYENFIRHLKANPRFYEQKESFKTLATIPVVTNMILIKSLAKKEVVSSFEREALSRVKGSWVFGYMRGIKNSRKAMSFKDNSNRDGSFQNAWNFYSRSLGK